jgi:hypothetical protein
MKKKKLSWLFAVLPLFAVTGWFVISMRSNKTDTNPGFNVIKMQEEAIVSALKSYSMVYGTLPPGNNESIERILRGEDLNGKNPRKIQFLNFQRNAGHLNEMVDPWGMPYQIEFQQKTNPVIRSAGKDKIFGNADDIIFYSISNDFVKP